VCKLRTYLTGYNSVIWRQITSIVGAIALPCVIAGCSLFGHGVPPPNPVPDTTSNDASNQAPSPEAKINISYSKPNDYLSSMVVTKYSAANTIATTPKGSNGVATTVLFEGGVVVWQADIDISTISGLPGIGSKKPYIVSHVKYGEIPRGFQQAAPESGPPEPLEPDNYYVFSVIRASGSTNYEAVKVQADGSLVAYDADPRAGNSFQLCCNVAPDFTVTAAGSENTQPPVVPAPDADSATPASGADESPASSSP
jgi:hypothetical protein